MRAQEPLGHNFSSTLMNGHERSAMVILVGLALVTLAIHMATNGNYGYHGDELYYIASGNHPAFGYVDYPPLVPLLAHLETSALGTSPWALRLLLGPARCRNRAPCPACVPVKWVRGGGPRLRPGALWRFHRLLLGANFLFRTVPFDQLTWLVTLYLLLRLLRSWRSPAVAHARAHHRRRAGDQDHHRRPCRAGVAVSGAHFAAAPTPDDAMALAGGAVAIALTSPFAIWQVVNSLPTLDYIRNHAADVASGSGVTNFVIQYLLLAVGVGLVPLWAYGLVWLWRSSSYRPLLVAVAIATLILLPNGKAYYPAPAIPAVMAAAVTGLGRSAVRRRTIRMAVGVGAALNLYFPFPSPCPLVPTADLHNTQIDTLRPDFAATVGSPEVTEEVATTYSQMPARAAEEHRDPIGVLQRGGCYSLFGPTPTGCQGVLSPHLTYWYWKPAEVTVTGLLVIGYQPDQLTFLCGQVTQVGTVVVPYGVINRRAR